MGEALNSFGRRGRPAVHSSVVRSAVVTPRSGLVAPQAQNVPGQTIDVFYTKRVSWMALVILVFSTMYAAPFFGSEHSLIEGGIDPKQLWAVYAIAVAIGLVYLVQGLRGARALRLNPHGVSGFTLLGTQNLPWDSISALQITSHQIHGDFLIIHGASTWLGRKFLLSSISIGLKHIDRSLDDLVSDMQKFRVDVPLPQKAGLLGI